MVKISTADVPIGVDENRHADIGAGASEWRVRGERSASVSLQGHDSDGTTTTAGWLEDAVLRLTRPDIQAILDAAGIAVINRGTVLDVSALFDTQDERRHLRDIELGYAVTDSGTGSEELELVELDLTLERFEDHPDPLVVDVDIDLT
jgi:hypothetical protein